MSSAKEADFHVEVRPDLVGAVFKGGTTPSSSLNPTDLPAESLALCIGRYTVVLGILPDVPTLEAVSESLRRYRNQCVIVRSFLNTNQSLDLQLMLVGPRGSGRDDAWRAMGLLVERDDRVARKMAWLRPESPQFDDEAFSEFVKRTFLARPWKIAGRFEDVKLDEVSETVSTIGGLQSSLVDEWERIALDADKTPDEIVAALVSAWEERERA